MQVAASGKKKLKQVAKLFDNKKSQKKLKHRII